MQPLPSDAITTSMFGFLNAKFQKTKQQTDRNNICSTKILGTQLFRTTQMCQGSTCHVVAQHGDISKLKKALLLTWEVCANHCHQMPSKHPCLDFSMLSSKKQKKQTDRSNICGTKILGTQLFRNTQMCQGSTCHVVAQHGDISKLKKALLLTWEVCATICNHCHQMPSRHPCLDFSMLSFNKPNNKPTEATFVAQRFLGHNC